MTGARANAGLVRKGNDECDKEHGEDLETPTVRAAGAAREAGQIEGRRALRECPHDSHVKRERERSVGDAQTQRSRRSSSGSGSDRGTPDAIRSVGF